MDIDSVPDNIDLDFDNDGITNCEESFGDLNLDLTGTSILKNTYSNSFSSSTTNNPLSSSASLVPKNNGDFMSEVPVGIGNSLEYKIIFTDPISLKMEYVSSANLSDLLNSDGEFIVKSDTDNEVKSSDLSMKILQNIENELVGLRNEVKELKTELNQRQKFPLQETSALKEDEQQTSGFFEEEDDATQGHN